MKKPKTIQFSPLSLKKNWHLIDLSGQVLGRVVTKISTLLIGKTNPMFSPHRDFGDYVVAINANQIVLTGRKSSAKTYYRHTGFPGGLRKEKFQQLLKVNPQKIIVPAVKGMLPKNKLRPKFLNRLKVFAGSEHPYKDKLIS